MFRFVTPTGVIFWATPGGGVDPGETYEQAVARELKEETGLESFELGPCVWTREHVFEWGDNLWRQRERFYLVRVPEFELTPAFTSEQLEAEGIAGRRWWTLAELDVTTHRLAPARLASLLRDLLERGPPGHPIDAGV